jgi:hypothetical protein
MTVDTAEPDETPCLSQSGQVEVTKHAPVSTK